MLRYLTLICALALTFASVDAGIPKGAMRLEDVTTLVFTKNEVTTSRRAGAVRQLACVGGPCQYAPNSAMCKNIGFDGRDVTWKCEAELPKGVKFGPVHVSCEGYASRDDDLVLKGSCGLEYELVGVPRYDSEEKDDLTFVERHTRSAALGYPKSWWSSWFGSSADEVAAGAKNAAHHAKDGARSAIHGAKDRAHHGYDHVKDVGIGYLPMISALVHHLFSISLKLVAFCIVMYLLYRFFRPTPAPVVSQPPPAQRRGLARSLIGMVPFGGTAMSLFDAFNPTGPAPPSYQQATAPQPPPSQSQPKTFQSQQQTYPQAASAPEAQSSGYGFLHGALGGAAAGYLLGRRRAPEATTTVPAAARTETVRHVYEERPSSHNPRYEAREVYTAPESPKTRETTTAFATTRRR